MTECIKHGPHAPGECPECDELAEARSIVATTYIPPAPLSEERISLDADNNGGWPAYPNQPLDGSGMPRAEHAPGLTKRELFAAMAMQGLCANETWELNHVPKQTASDAVEYADALLKELAK